MAMVVNVFGTPITTKTLEGMREYQNTVIRRIDRAHVALDRKQCESKYADAQEYVHNLKERCGSEVATLCLIYNATGDPVTFVHEQNWYNGHIWDIPYPSEIANGQWGAFLHVKNAADSTGSFGAIVYRGQNDDDVYCDWLAAWANPSSGDNKAFTEIRQKGHYDEKIWTDIYNNYLEKSDLTHEDTWNGCKSTATILQGNSPYYEATFTLNGADNPDEP